MLLHALRLPAHRSSAATGDTRQPTASIWLTRALDVVVILAGGLVLSRNHADPDFWGHVQYGQDVLRDGLPATATYTYTAKFFPWINHENLSELAFAWGLSWGGPAMLLAAKTILGMMLVMLLIRRARQAGATLLAAQAIALLIALNLMHFWSLRPQLFSFLFFIAEMAVLDGAFRAWKDQRTSPPPLSSYRGLLWLAPLLIAVWTNTHGGFVLGVAVLLAYLGVRSIEGLWRWKAAACPTAIALGTISIVCLLATWLNPYGWDLHRWLFDDLRVPRPEIIEWRPPQLFDIVWWQWWLLVAVVAGAVAGSRCRRDWVELAILAVVLWQSLEHLRHIPFAAILCGMWLPQHIASFLNRVGLCRDDAPLGDNWSKGGKRACFAALGLVAAVIVVQIIQQARQIPVHRDSYPVSAFRFIADQQLTGRMVVRFKWSQYAIAAFGSTEPNEGIQVAFDGRFRTCYPQAVADMYFDFAVRNDPSDKRPRSPESPPCDPKRILYYGKPDLVLIDRSQELPATTMREHQDRWTLLYQDQVAELWGLREKYDRPTSPHYLPPTKRSISHAQQVGFVKWPALPTRNIRNPASESNPSGSL